MLYPALLFLNFLSLTGSQPQTPQAFQPMQWPSMEAVISWQSPWVLEMNAPDADAVDIVRSYLQGLVAQGFPAGGHGVWVQTGATAVAAYQGYESLPAASLTKIPTTLAALATWPVNHRFETLVGYTGTIEGGVLQGDLVLYWDGDPYFVWEEAIALGNTLQASGIEQVTGNLVILGDFSMNFETDPYRSGELFIEALDVSRWSGDAWWIYNQMPADTPQPTLAIAGQVVQRPAAAVSEVSQWQIRHQSLHLVALLKAMNIYSNNVMAEQLAQAAGGTGAVVTKSVEATGLPRAEISLINGSGLGEENRLSPRAVVAMLLAIQRQLRPFGLSVADVMPVFGQDEGTLIYRDLPTQSALKTGTLNAVSSLAGFFPTQDRGPVWFSIQNQGFGVDLFRAQQDALLAALEQHWGQAAAPENLTPKVILGQPPYRLGDPSRNLPF